MKAAQLTHYGGKDAIALAEVPTPQVGEGKILVEVHAAGVNPFDWKVQAGYLKEMIPLQLPVTLGGDFSGVVTDVGPEVTEYKIGDQIYGQANFMEGGSFAQYTSVSSTRVAPKPEKLDFVQAGALPLVGSSALQALTDHIKLSSGQKILIHGGAGGIGSISIQIAKYLGAYVATTVSSDDVEYVKGLGADQIIDYKSEQFENVVKDFDAVFDTVGGETAKKSFDVLKKGGVLVSMVGPLDEELAKTQEVTAIAQSSEVTTERLKKLADLVTEGVVSVHVEKVFPLEEAAEALDYLQKTPPQGKVVLKIR